ncbi:YccF domain-containing protein [Shewanella sp. A3A]|nr:YccF domain-containing protein [Shewanella ferrihydritica]
MSVLRLIFNIAWFLLGGLLMGLAWWFVGLLCFISIIGIPFGRACFVIGELAFWPFGQEHISRDQLYGREDIGTGALGLLGNIVWFLLFGIWLAIGHLVHAVGCFVTIIGIPFGIQHIKLALLSLMPIGKTIVNSRTY